MIQVGSLQAPARRRASAIQRPACRDSSIESGGANQGRGPDLAETILSIIVECGEPARVLELYYWSEQPGFGDAMRALALLPDDKRAIIQSFLALATNAANIDVVMHESGRLSLSSPEVAAQLKASHQPSAR
jgi:hypothetical protein